ncbi:MAG: cytochrome P450 [Anaerolineales bacterium]|nr:cytochrome P450 [Anaerolineales bacterium]
MKPTAPGPSSSTLLRQIQTIQRDPLSFLTACARQYGPLVRFPIGNLAVFAVNAPELVKHVLQDNHRNYGKNTIQFNTLAMVTGRGLLTSDGGFWLRQRRLLQPAFHRQRLAGFGCAMTAAAEQLLAEWDARPADTAPLDVDAAMMTTTLAIVGRTLFNADLRVEAADLVPAVLTALDFIVYRAQTPLAWPLVVPTPRNLRFQAARRRLEAAVSRLNADRRAFLAGGGAPPDDLLQMLLDARDDAGQPMTERQLRDELITLIIAGHETVASALTWTWHLLAQNPLAEARLRAELATVLAGRAPTPDDLPRLPYTRAVFEEALRLYPPAWLITRQALGPDTLAGHAIPAGALLIISPYVIQRRPEVWPDPEAFQPERFLEGAPDTPRFGYLPFGGGPRQCIGNGFALLEGTLILAMVAQRYQLRPAPGSAVRVDALVTLRPHDGLWMTVRQVQG